MRTCPNCAHTWGPRTTAEQVTLGIVGTDTAPLLPMPRRRTRAGPGGVLAMHGRRLHPTCERNPTMKRRRNYKATPGPAVAHRLADAPPQETARVLTVATARPAP